MNMHMLQMLRKIDLFRGLSEAALLCLADRIRQHTYAPGVIISLEGELCNVAYFVIAGEVRVYRLSLQGRQQVLAQLKMGQAFNTVPLFLPDGRNRASVMALTEVTLYAVSRDDFLRVMRECPELSWIVLRDFAARLAHLTDLVEDLSLHSVRGRLARFLLGQADGKQVTQRWTQDDIAAHLGTVRDMVGRSLRALVDGGLIRMGRGRIELLDRDGLETEAES
jgi:CRP/FNR family cyclic AMP-dependent transcriptional regulator